MSPVVIIEISADAGQTWQYHGGFTIAGDPSRQTIPGFPDSTQPMGGLSGVPVGSLARLTSTVGATGFRMGWTLSTV